MGGWLAGVTAVSRIQRRRQCFHLHLKASIRTYCIASDAIIGCAKGNANAVGGRGERRGTGDGAGAGAGWGGGIHAGLFFLFFFSPQ